MDLGPAGSPKTDTRPARKKLVLAAAAAVARAPAAHPTATVSRRIWTETLCVLVSILASV